MKIDLQSFTGPCACGREHRLDVKEISVEAGAILRLPDLFRDGLLKPYGCPLVICDRNTYEAAGRKVLELIKADCICLPPEGLHADNRAVFAVKSQMSGDTDLILAVGSGTVHDVSRYLAGECGIPFVSIPTAASVDGFVSTVAAMTWNGLKITFPAVAPIAVLADTSVFAAAPYRLTASGISDLMGKYTALADWKVSHLVTGEYFCEQICGLEYRAVEAVRECLPDIKDGKPEACEKLMYALLLSGLAMQMAGNSRPASGAEHHVSHLWEMEVINPHTDAYHGEKVSAGLIMCLKEYERMKDAIQSGHCGVTGYAGPELELLRSTFGEKGLLDGILKENTPDPLLEVDADLLKRVLPEIAGIWAELPSSQEVKHMLTKAGCVTDMEGAGVDPALRQLTLTLSPYVRSRLTGMRLGKMLKME